MYAIYLTVANVLVLNNYTLLFLIAGTMTSAFIFNDFINLLFIYFYAFILAGKRHGKMGKGAE